jgi:hypothetical protein
MAKSGRFGSIETIRQMHNQGVTSICEMHMVSSTLSSSATRKKIASENSKSIWKRIPKAVAGMEHVPYGAETCSSLCLPFHTEFVNSKDFCIANYN